MAWESVFCLGVTQILFPRLVWHVDICNYLGHWYDLEMAFQRLAMLEGRKIKIMQAK